MAQSNTPETFVANSNEEQTARILPKKWVGRISATNIGAPNWHNPHHDSHTGSSNLAPDWNINDQKRTFTILRQEDQHLELLYESPHAEDRWIGNLSFDGKELLIASRYSQVRLTIDGNKMAGCGSSRGGNGLFKHWLESYSAICFELTATTE